MFEYARICFIILKYSVLRSLTEYEKNNENQHYRKLFGNIRIEICNFYYSYIEITFLFNIFYLFFHYFMLIFLKSLVISSETTIMLIKYDFG